MTTTALGERLARQLREKTARAGARAAVSLEVELRRNWQVHASTSSETRKSISVRLESTTPTSLTYRAVADTPQARWVNDGTAPHIIHPKGAASNVAGSKWPSFTRGERLLVFDWPKAGMHPAKFRWVEHPGYRGSGWFDFTLAQWPDLVEQAWVSA